MTKRIAVVGYYNQGNIGDEAFKRSIPMVLGDEHEYDFRNDIPPDINDNYTHLIIGGGSFLDQRIPGIGNQVKIPVGFLGVGVHSQIQEDNLVLLETAEVVVARNRSDCRRGQSFFLLPDLVFLQAHKLIGSYPSERRGAKKDKDKHVVVIPNGFLIPEEDSVGWKKKAFHSFRTMLEVFEECYGSVEYVPMQTTYKDDRWWAPGRDVPPASEENLCNALVNADLVIATRFHGCVYATILGVPFVGVSPHDKMVSFFNDRNWYNYVDYYNFTLTDIREAEAVCPWQYALIETSVEHNALWTTCLLQIRIGLGL